MTSVVPPPEADPVEGRAVAGRLLQTIHISLLVLLREAWAAAQPEGSTFLPEGTLTVRPGSQIEAWFSSDQGVHRFLEIFGRGRGRLSLTAQTKGWPAVKFVVQTGAGEAALSCDLRGSLLLPLKIDATTRLGLQFTGPLTLEWLALQLDFRPDADGEKQRQGKPAFLAIPPPGKSPAAPLLAVRSHPVPPGGAAPVQQVPDSKPVPVAADSARTAVPRPPFAPAPAVSPASRADLAMIEFRLADFLAAVTKVAGASAFAGPPATLAVDITTHNYAWIGDQRGLGAAVRAAAGHIVRMHLHGIVHGTPNIEAFLGFRDAGQWNHVAARPGYSASVRVPETFEAVRIGLRLAGNGRLDDLRIGFAVEHEVVANTRLELRRQGGAGGRAQKLKVALIADPFTHENFTGITDIVAIRPNTWRSLMSVEHPDFLFIESAWVGNDGAWANRIVNNTEELANLIAWCRASGIPAVFWNKEDPVHFHRFLPAARLADLVYTTCAECVADYRKAGIGRVAVLPFAVNLATYNPIGSGRPRERHGVFAGSYYGAKYPERTANMETLLDLTAPHGLRIFDRHAGSTGAEFAFPERYRGHIVGSASVRQLDAEYKRARMALNVNTVKDSRSMFARRVVEVAITGTPIVSNASPALSELFGNALVASDDANELRAEIDRLFADDAHWQKRRRDLMRTVLMAHTMQDRLDTILRELDVPLPDPRRAVCLVVLPSAGAEQPAWWQAMPVRFDVEAAAARRPLGEIIPEQPATDYVCIVRADSVLDEATLLELLRHQEYAQADIVGLTVAGQTFRYGAQVDPLAMLMRRSALTVLDLSAADLETPGHADRLRDAGVKIFGVERLSRPVAPVVAPSPVPARPGPAWLSGWWPGGEGLTIGEEGDGFFAVKLTSDKPAYIRLGDRHPLAEAPAQPLVGASGQSGLAVSFECERGTPEITAEVQVYFYCGRPRSATRVVPANVQAFARAPDGWTTAQLAVRLKGPGTLRFRVALAGDVQDAAAFVRCRLAEQQSGGPAWVCVSSVYPHPENIYRNAFVHSRVRRYRVAGKDVRVVSMDGNAGVLVSYDFEGVQVFAGAGAALADVLQARPWGRALCHIVSTEMLRVLDEHAPGMRKIVWVHAIEAERWYRRWFNLDFTRPDLEQRLLGEYRNSDTRTQAVREVYLRSGNTGSDCRTIFVSEWFRRNIAVVDVRPAPRDYRVIHNPIDTSLFHPRPKIPADRFNWLSIRPYASRKYANDLTVAAILLLMKESWFLQVRISIVGRGPLFDEVVAPLRGMANVSLENRFLLQSEIAAYHARNGIFLCPTRHDSQGVSLGEAMSSGLVPVSNDCMAIPEFVPRAWGVLAPPDDPAALADCIRRLVEDPDHFVRLSAEVAAHIARKCGDAQVIPQEIDAITSD